MFKVLVAEDEPKSRGALISRLRGILGDAALIEAASDGMTQWTRLFAYSRT